jgi:hypothetical protein
MVLFPDIDTYIKSKKKQNEIYNAIETINAVGAKAKWAEMWCNSQYSTFAEGLITFAKKAFFRFLLCNLYSMTFVLRTS